MNKKMLKRSLFLGALMTAVITGNALAANETKYFYGDGNPITVGADKTPTAGTKHLQLVQNTV